MGRIATFASSDEKCIETAYLACLTRRPSPDELAHFTERLKEAGKGEQRVQEATELLSSSGLNFIGNIEGRHLVSHAADVVVCDAAVGNVTIKFFEGLSTFIFDLLRAELRRPPRGPLAYLLLKPGLDRIRTIFDYEKLGGSPLLGVQGTVLITHGRARRRMVSYAVAVGAAAARARVPDLIADAFKHERRGRPHPPAGEDAEREQTVAPVGTPVESAS